MRLDHLGPIVARQQETCTRQDNRMGVVAEQVIISGNVPTSLKSDG